MSIKGKIGIIGSGLIGRGWAMLFASAAYKVQMYDVDPTKVDDALTDIEQQLKKLEATGYLRGKLTADQQFRLIAKCCSVKECMSDSIHVQECVLEDLELKKKLFTEIDQFASDDVVICSSTSSFPASSFSEGLEHRPQVLVAHPVNPPYYVPLVELVPAPWTKPEFVTKTKQLVSEIGQKPVVLKEEIPGFALNRIQFALISECWRLFNDGVMSLEDIDTSVHEGIGPRYAFIGPLEICHLNADGMEDYCNRYGHGVHAVSKELGPNVRMEGELAEKVHADMCKVSPLEHLADRRKWRDARLSALAKMKRELDEKDE